jgi:hypothetical protein
MKMQMKYIVFVVGCAALGWVGYFLYGFAFDMTTPSLILRGIENGSYYGGDVECKISSDKTGQLAIALDGKSLINNFKLSSRDYDHPFTIPTKTINNGEHTLSITLTDRTFNKNKATIERTFFVDNLPLQAAFVKQDPQYRVFQGRTLHVQLQVNKPIERAQVHVLSHSYDCFPESPNSSIYEAYVAIPCEEIPNEYLLAVEVADHVGNKMNLEDKVHIIPFPFKKQTLHVDGKKVEEERALGESQALLDQKFQELTAASPKNKLWRGAFCTPIDVARTTCDFGTVRTTQEKGRYMHKALDVVNTPRCVVWATQDGVIALKERYELTGNTVIVDHGCGVLSMFCHLEDFAPIEVGQKIVKGNPIGTMGKTGYASGYHLHWEMRLNNIQIDPMQWTKANF